MLTIKVKPNKDSAKKLQHPNGPVLGEGALWPNDSFTARRLADKSVVRDGEVAEAAEPKQTVEPSDHPAG